MNVALHRLTAQINTARPALTRGLQLQAVQDDKLKTVENS
jgi:hypothetical protein